MTERQSTGAAKRQIATLQKRVKELESEVDYLEMKLDAGTDTELIDAAAEDWTTFIALLTDLLGDPRHLSFRIRCQMEEIDGKFGR